MWCVSLLLLLLCSCVNADDCNSEEVKSFEERNFGERGGFVFLMPRELLSGKNVNACVTLHNARSLPTKVTVDLEILGEHYDTIETLEADYSCFEVMVPSLDPTNRESFYINVSVTIPEISETKLNMDPVRFLPRNDTLFLQTDRLKYRPGDQIRIRVFVLNEDLLPGIRRKISAITIRNSAGKLEQIWEDEPLLLGFAHLEYQLSERALEGKWFVEADGRRKVVEVTKHAAPRFQTLVNSTSGIYVHASAYYYQVCGMYSYGKPVKGTASIKLIVEPSLLQFLQQKETERGCANFTISAMDFNISNTISNRRRYYNPNVKLEASITESGTELNVTITKTMRMDHDPYHLRIDFPHFYRPGFPTSGEVELVNINQRYDEEMITICYSMTTDRDMRFEEIVPCANYTFDVNNKVLFAIPPLGSQVRSIYVTMYAEDHKRASYAATSHRIHSPTGTYLYIKQNAGDELNCGASQHFTIYYNANDLSDELTFYYTVKSADSILIFNKILPTPSQEVIITPESLTNVVNGEHKYTNFGAHIKSFNIDIVLDANILWKYECLVYTVLVNGEIVADSKQVNLEPCLQNRVALKWSKDSYSPGETARGLVKTSPGSLCSFVAMNSIDSYNFDLKNILSAKKGLKPYRELHSFERNCVAPVINPQESVVADETEGSDIHGTFKDFGGTLLTNLKTITKPCRVYRLRRNTESNRRRPKRAVPTSTITSEETSGDRTSWSETWLWDLIQVDDSGSAEITKKIPHDVTKWFTNVACISPIEGIGLSVIDNVTTFKPFFVDVVAPTTIRRGEVSKIHIKLFNYCNDSASVKLQIHGDEKVNILSTNIPVITINGDDIADYSLEIRFIGLGPTIITVTADADNARDVVQKQVLIKPEGYRVAEVKTELLCSNGVLPKTLMWNIDLPADAVPNINKSEIILDAQRLGQKIERVGELLSEETDDLMELLIRNWYILRYLDTIHTANTSIFIKYIEQAYNQILTFKNDSGSSNEFRSSKTISKPSLSLTAFAIKNLVRSKQYISVDENVIDTVIKWIYGQQLVNGCFATDDDTNSSQKEEGPSIVTSYVLSSLLEANVDTPAPILDNAKRCIFNSINNTTDEYARAACTYALFLLGGSRDEAMRLLNGLMERFPINNKPYETATVHEIQTVAYILLSLHFRNDTQAHSAYVRQAVQWLRAKVATRDVFQLRQESVVALDALAKYGAVPGFENDVQIHLTVSGQSEEVTFGRQDNVKVKRVSLKEISGTLHLNLSGDGCAYVEAVIEYTTPNLTYGPAYQLKLNTELNKFDKYCAHKVIPCVALGGNYVYSHKTVMEVVLPQGFVSVSNSVYHLRGGKVTGTSEVDGKVYVYFEKMTNVEVCTPFNIVEKVANGTYKGSVKIYDYYNHDLETTEMFNVAPCVKTDSA